MRFCLRHILQLLLLSGAVSFSAPAQVPATNSLVVLTNVAQVRALTAEEAGRKVPIRLRGVVIEKTVNNAFIIVDDTAALYAEPVTGNIGSFNRGDLIEVEGVSDPGRFGPFMKASKARNLGRGQRPEPLKPDADDLLSGCLDAQWIEVSGVVRRVEPVAGGVSCEVSLDNGGGRLLVNASGRRTFSVDSRVQLRGICYYLFNTTRQVIRPYLAIPDGEPVVVTEAGTADLNALPLRPAQSLLQFSPNQTYAHRVRVRGVVLSSQAGEGFWIRDGRRGLHVYCDEKEPPEAGAEVDVYGFLKRGEYLPALEDAIFRKTGQVRSVAPVQLTNAAEALEHDCDLVACQAVILERWSALDGCRLKLSDGATEFLALLREKDEMRDTRRWRPGARVCVVGICDIGLPTAPNRPGAWEPQSFQLLLRSPADVVILQPPPWWNAEHMAWLFGAMAAALLVVVGVVVWTGRRRLREKAMERMKAEAEFAAVWNERNRMAREMHDTLAQGLSAISMQLEVLKRHLPAETKPRELLDVARSLVREKMVEARNAIWNVRSQVLENGDLATALGNILRSLTDGTETKGEVRVRGRLRRLAPVAENNLLRIGQEAVTNAAKYAAARNILVTLEFEERQLRMSVSDDGKGFNVNSPPPSEGGFGLKGMRERAAQIYAEFSVASEPGEGTIVTLVLPLSN